jgi:hypothetical protein
MEDGDETFFADLFTSGGKGNVGYEIECMSIDLSDSCTVSEAAALVENTVSEGLHIEFSERFTELAELKLANCEIAGKEEGIVEGLGFIKGDGEEDLTASE